MNEYFEYLTDLRDGGTMNMMWAPTMLQSRFDLGVKESREVFQKWCDSLAESYPPLPAHRSAEISQKKAPAVFRRAPHGGGIL